ncbi:alanine--tRNA ligase [Caproiciproducens sp. NJN-50]|uniref:alanine--tRNA ligase n=1 Tax=Acutalibacteraceae TaxID=3082771 RepID=UPI000FFE1839|nr:MULTISPECIES: alanine--tRNA ligase [Acutalibacteraceae]QAT49576.1 alanine--tRNA ligase [Caproiciproducens sp. NJN-50]
MKWTGLNELREIFLSYFESKGHLRLPSFPLIPKDDNSLLLINSGMAPMKKYFTGEVTPPRKRVTTCQKCIRTPDIERVGITARHGTFFEMLGNFSFGDYFKHEAIPWAWEFCTKVLELPVDKLWVTIYLDDDEAYDIWVNEVGVDPKHIVRLGKEDNFWEHGSGPCGPCSEIYFDRGEQYGCGKPTCGVGCDCDRYVEFWNVVFSQFDSDGKGNYPPMEHPNIDTGMGLERLACIMQGVDNLFLVDTVQNIMKHICKITGVNYGDDQKKDVSLRVITDHIRSTVFMIGDGVMPSNEGRGYVLRRLLRRAARHGRLLGVHDTFLWQVADTVIAENCGAYPELAEKRDMIVKLLRVEEESFSKTVDQGLSLVNGYLDETVKAGSKVFSGAEAFLLSDTYGFPIDLTKEIAAERGLAVDEEEFARLMSEQKERARAARKNAGADAWAGENNALDGVPETVFAGYKTMETEGRVLAILSDGEPCESATAGDEVAVILDKTSFYAESGGQVGDTGTLESDGAVLTVTGTTKNRAKNFLHRAVVTAGELHVGDMVKTSVDAKRRLAVMRNHTSAHLLQAALRRVLGTHVEQAGQLVDEHRVRFDFTHFSALTGEELRQVEALVNREILSGLSVDCREMPIGEAKKLGAMALFGEKYGNVVRVVSAGDFSREFCGGTHMDNTAKIGLFKIISESGIAAGVRRIEAVTGTNVLAYLDETEGGLRRAAAALKVNNPAELAQRAEQVASELKEKDREIESLNGKLASMRMESLFAGAKDIGGVRLITAKLEGADAEALRLMCDRVKEHAPDLVAVLAGAENGRANIAVACAPEAQKKGAHAGKIVKEVASLAGGGGGGRPDSAMAGTKHPEKLDEALAAAQKIVANMIK